MGHSILLLDVTKVLVSLCVGRRWRGCADRDGGDAAKHEGRDRRGETNEHFHLLIFQLSVELLPHIDGLPRSQILTLARQIMQKMQYVGMVKAELLVT